MAEGRYCSIAFSRKALNNSGKRMSHFAIWFIWSLGLGSLSVLGARGLARKLGWLDHPNERSLHTRPTPRIGGIGMLVPLLAALVVLYAFFDQEASAYPALLLFPAFLVATLSYVDDRMDLSRLIRFSGHLFCGLIILLIFRQIWFEQPLPLVGTSLPPALAAVLLLIWIAGLTNAFNFMDGIDGLAATQALVVTLGWLSFHLLEPASVPVLAQGQVLILVSLMGGVVAFLLLNWSPASIFMGDIGSTFLGFFFASLPFGAHLAGIPFDKALEAGVLFTWPFIADAGGTLLMRLVTRQKIFEPHRMHVYQVLAASFSSREQGHRLTSLLYGLLSLLGIGIFWTPGPLWAKLVVLFWLWCAMVAWTYGLRSKGPFLSRNEERPDPDFEAVNDLPVNQTGKFEIFLSPPELTEVERRRVEEALASGYIAPVGPQVDAFEEALAQYLGVQRIQTVNSGTAAIHLGLRALGVGPGDCVLCPDLTFIATVNPVRYLGAEAVLVDVDPANWAMDREAAGKAIRILKGEGRRVKAMIIVHAFGVPAPMDGLMELARSEGVRVLEDCAGALGTRVGEQLVGTFGDAAAFSFNGNKVLTTSGGGAVLLRDPEQDLAARRWANQGKESGEIGYNHSELGYNYRLSNISAAIGLGQLETLSARLDRKTAIFEAYREELVEVKGIRAMPEPAYGKNNYWLSCFGTESSAPGQLVSALQAHGIEATPMWKPMHAQRVNQDLRCFGGECSDKISRTFFSLPSGTTLTPGQIDRVCRAVRAHLSS